MRVKAAEGRALLVVVSHMLQKYFDCESPHNRLRLRCVQALCRVYREINNWSDESPLRLGRFAREHLLLYSELGRNAPEGMYRILPKHHMLLHVCEGVSVNPRLLWNYSDESEIGLAGKTALRCNPRNLSVRMIRMFRRRYLLH